MKTKEKPVKTSNNINETWKLFHKTGDSKYRNTLMEHYRSIVKYTADRLHTKLPDKVDVDDLISAGNFGLMDAIYAFDPGRGVKFETFCSPRIKGSILDELRSMDWAPRLVRSRTSQLTKATQSLEANLGRKPTKEELADKLKLDMEEFERIIRDATAVNVVSLDTQYNNEEGDKDIREIDVIKDEKSIDPLVGAQKRDLKSLLDKGLTRAERLIITLYYYEEMTMKEIGLTLDLSESRVSQMHSSIINRLKAHLNDRKKEFAV
jgi:RNA polymerase sigma factor for flagellar operon FliA